MTDPKQLIVVLGAHRSGTSLCAAAVEALGAETCLGEHYANEENRKGFFEHPEIVEFNDSLLEHCGGSWDNPLFEGGQILAGAGIEPWVERAVALFSQIYGAAQRPVIKDPRICQLFSFWREVFNRSGFSDGQIFVVHTLRDPAEVAVSQRKRAQDNPLFYEYGRNLAEGAALWASLTAQSLEQSRGLQQLCLGYAGLQANADELMPRLADFLNLDAERRSVATFASEFVDPGLYRSVAPDEARAETAAMLPQAEEMYTRLLSLLEGFDTSVAAEAVAIFRQEACQQRLVRIAAPALSRLSARSRLESLALQRSREEIEDFTRQVRELEQNTDRVRREHREVLEPLREQLVQLEAGNAGLQSQLADQAAELRRVSEESRDTINQLLHQKGVLEEDIRYQSEVIAQMEASTSWKLTRPLRAFNARRHALGEWRVRQWSQVRLNAIQTYHRMSLTHPALAYGLRRLVSPLFRLLNLVVGGGNRNQVRLAASGLLSPMLYQQTEKAAGFAPLVSVIVPNYNHEAYLRLRLESIYSQTYRNFEVILLDDASSDNSAAILREFQQRHADRTTLVVNESNSGGVFHQWDKGLGLARGDIIWIAESDDWCTENFLQKLVPFFENEAVQVAYSQTVFMDGEGERQTWSIQEYLHDIDPQRWNHSFVATAPGIVRDAFAVKNIIPNVSSALFRSPQQLDILSDPEWRAMRVCGDWVLYLHLLRGGMLAYSPEACNYYRQHGRNTSTSSHVEDQFYREHEAVAKTLCALYDVPLAALQRLRDNLEVHWRETRGNFTDEALEHCFSVERIQREAGQRAPNLLIASYAFCAGGGETFPVSLANIMKSHGYNVTYLDCAREPRMEGVRRRLRPDIPIVSDYSQLERIVNDFEIDIVHSHHAWVDSTIFEVLPEDIRSRIVVTSHGMYETINEYDLRHILPRLVRRSAAIIYVADKNLNAIRSHGLLDAANVERIDNALEPTEFTPLARSELGIGDDAFVLTLVSRGLVDKGWQEAVEAVLRARQESGRNIHLVLVGDGPEYERLSTDGVPDCIHLEGFQENVRGYFALADMGLLPSKFRGESFPLVIIECLQTGRPFLASDLGEIRRMLEGDRSMAGAVVPLVGDEIDLDALVASIVHFAVDGPAYREVSQAVPDATAKFDPAVLARRHDEVYRSVLAQDSALA
ncbi:glycosyltransferase [Haliea sp. E17]|uniref:glycosyltransferase n=1 Tax=Haliea sp. E17 TaxID=3401576 RepID=UPI003AACAF9D